MIVAFKPGRAMQAENALLAAGGEVRHRIFGMDAMAIEVPVPALAGLEHNPNIDYVEEDAPRYLMGRAASAPLAGGTSTTQVVPYGIAMVQANQLAGQNASNRKICIIDSGYDGGHEDLAHDPAQVTGVDDPAGAGDWDVDTNHHGTHVAGTIAAQDNGVGVVGVAPTVKLHIVKVFDENGWAYSSTLASAANKCGAAGANVISMSLGGTMSNRTEQKAFDALYAGNILPIAAAGNDGNTRTSYPAGYASVMSVAAIDANKALASFSQRNKDVEIAAPGVGVQSTVPMGAGTEAAATVGGIGYDVAAMEGSPDATASGALFDFGLGTAVNAGAAGKVCLIQRGTVDFAVKVGNCQSSGGVAAIIYNNVAGSFGGTLGTTVTSIPSVSASDTDGAALLAKLGSAATVSVAPSNYDYYDGTSMATPHVSAVAALVWSAKTGCTAAQVRGVLTGTAQDLGAAGRDTSFGYGLVRTKAARDKLLTGNCGK